MNQLKDFILNNRFTSIAQNFIHKQSWEALRNNELTLGYDELVQLTNQAQEDEKITINQMQQVEDEKIRLLVTHQNTEQISLDLTIHEFKLLPKKAYISFSPKINSIKALEQTGFVHHVKIFFVNFFAVSFNDTILDKIFKAKTLNKGIYSNIVDGKVIIEFWEAVEATTLGKTFLGFTAFDFLQITDIKPNEKGLGIRFNIQIPDWVKTFVFLILTSLINKIINGTFKTKNRFTL